MEHIITNSDNLSSKSGAGGERIETTLGDLIHAISEAAKESHIEEDQLAPVTMKILEQMMSGQ